MSDGKDPAKELADAYNEFFDSREKAESMKMSGTTERIAAAVATEGMSEVAKVGSSGAGATAGAAGTVAEVGKAAKQTVGMGMGLEAGKRVAKGFMSAFTSGSLFIVLALVINLFLDLFTPWGFAGFDFSKYSSVGSLSEIKGLFMVIYMIVKGPLLVLSLALGAAALEKRHIAMRVFLAGIIIFYTTSLLPAILQGYFVLAGIDLIIFILFAIKLLNNPSREDYTSLVIFTVLVYSIIQVALSSGYYGAFFHIILILLFYFIQGSKYKKEDGNYRIGFITLILFDFFFPWFLNSLPSTGAFSFSSLPILTLGIVFMVEKYEPTWFSKAMLIFILIGSILLMGWSSLATIWGSGEAVGEMERGEEIKERTKIFEFWNWGEYFGNRMNDSINKGSGQERYASQVDENSKKKLGVYLEDFSKNIKKYYDNEEVVLDATLTAENIVLDEEDAIFDEAIYINLSCAAYKSKDKDPIKGKIYPKDQYRIENYDIENIQCIFEPWQLEKGSYDVKIEAKFNFKTEAYLKRYFVLKDRIDSLRKEQLVKQDSDILKLNKIDDLNPVAKNSVAPIQIEVSDRIPPIIKLDKSEDTVKIFAVKLENKWKGKVDRITNIVFFLPEGITLDEGKCYPFSMRPAAIADVERYEDYTIWELREGDLDSLRKIEKDVEQRCGLLIKGSDVDGLMQPGDITTRYFRMVANYDYVIEEKTNVQIEEEAGFHLKILSSYGDKKVLDSSATPVCEAKNEENINTNVNFAIYEGDSETSTESGEIHCSDESCKYDNFNVKYEEGTRLKCEATMTKTIEGVDTTTVARSYLTVKNSVPVIDSVDIDKIEVERGETIRCSVEASDHDQDDKIMVLFNFDGVAVASTEKECDNGCGVDIPTDSAKSGGKIKCTAIAYDGEDRSEAKFDEANVVEASI